MKIVLAVIFAIAALVPSIQDKPTPPPAPPVVSADMQVRILKTQREAERVQSEYRACQQRNWGQEFTGDAQAFQAAVDAAFAEAKVSKDDWDLNTETLVFVKKDKTAKKPAEEKKPEKP
jgi:hypothetical protein